MSQTAEQWRQVILTFASRAAYANPFLDVCICGCFIGPSGRVIRREAYWDGGQIYRVSFAPTEIGLWRYRLEAPAETGLDGVCGTLECVPYSGTLPIYRHGFLKVSPNGRYFTYADGTPFFWLGDTHWEFAYKERWDESNHPAMTSMFRGMADRRAAQGYTVYQTNLRSDAAMGGDALYWDKTSPTDLPNLTFYQQELDRRMLYLAELGFVNALGLAWFLSIGPEGEFVEHEKHLARYIIARYGALPLCWTLAGETAGYAPGEPHRKNVDFWRQVALYQQELDGYGNLQTAHYTNERPFADYYQDEDWFDFTLNQAGHGDLPINAALYRDFMHRHPGKPFVEGEALYEFCSTLEELGTRLCTPAMLRRVAYMSIQCGGCGYTYGAQGIWDNVWEKGQPNPMAIFNRFDITWAEAIDGPGGAQMGYMKSFYLQNRFWELAPCTGEADPAAGDPFGKKLPLVTASADRTRWVLYYPESARSGSLLTGLPMGEYRAQWFDPRTGEYLSEQRFAPAEGCWQSPKKPDPEDWLLLVEAAQ